MWDGINVNNGQGRRCWRGGADRVCICTLIWWVRPHGLRNAVSFIEMVLFEILLAIAIPAQYCGQSSFWCSSRHPRVSVRCLARRREQENASPASLSLHWYRSRRGDPSQWVQRKASNSWIFIIDALYQLTNFSHLHFFTIYYWISDKEGGAIRFPWIVSRSANSCHPKLMMIF